MPRGRRLFVQDLYGGADGRHRIAVRVYNEKAWTPCFIRHLLRRPAREELSTFAPEMTIVDLPSFKVDPKRYGVRHRDRDRLRLQRQDRADRGTAYAGEMRNRCSPSSTTSCPKPA